MEEDFSKHHFERHATHTDEDGYIYQDDYKRKPIADNIITLLKGKIEISPMVIDGQWGNGKSEFCHKLINLIEDEHQKLKPVYLNAYQYDYSDDAFMMLLSAITGLIDDDDSIKGEIIKASSLVLKVTHSVSTQLAHKLIGIDFAKVVDDMVKSDSKLAGNITAFEDFTKNLGNLKTALKAYTKNKEIVIFIDELDRCNPIFALSLLEKVKHIFDVTGIQFVFITNMQELAATIQNQYGTLDAKTYLSKFFIFKIGLSDKVLSNHSRPLLASAEHFYNFAKEKNINTTFITNNFANDLINFLFRKDKRSLRDAERYLKNFEIFQTLQSRHTINTNTSLLDKLFIMLTLYIITFDSADLALTNKFLTKSFKKEDIDKLLLYDDDAIPQFNRNQINAQNIVYMLLFMHLQNIDAHISDINEWQQHLSTQDIKRWLTGDETTSDIITAIEKMKISTSTVIVNTIRTMQFVEQ